MNYYDNLSISIMHHYYHQRIMQMYILDQNMIQKNVTVSRHKNIILDLVWKKSKSFEWQVSLYFLPSTTKHLYHICLILVNTLITQITKFHSYDQMIKIVVNLGSNKYKNNYYYTFQLRSLQNSLLISIVDTPEKDQMLIGNQT